MIAPFIGGLGDALSMVPILREIRRRHPEMPIDIATTPGPAEVFELMPMIRSIQSYPLEASSWEAYEHFLSMEVVHTTGQAPGRALPVVFAEALGILLADETIRLDPGACNAELPLELGRQTGSRVGFAVGEGYSLRPYPLASLQKVIERLRHRGITCVLFGLKDPLWPIDAIEAEVIDLRSRTSSVAELGACLQHMDAIVAHDSFILHLAGAMQRPTFGLFAPTSQHHGDPYPGIQRLVSQASCTPCHEASERCPKGYPRCVAWDDQAVDPEAVASWVLRTLGHEMTEQAKPTSNILT